MRKATIIKRTNRGGNEKSRKRGDLIGLHPDPLPPDAVKKKRAPGAYTSAEIRSAIEKVEKEMKINYLEELVKMSIGKGGSSLANALIRKMVPDTAKGDGANVNFNVNVEKF